ncbi:MAG TPA: hypothetical protein VLG16_02550 [Candidatus Saccharimonadales bacterium]|nr:hypothetical protein [Candidatus Saccharimonadales bacterium]
MPKLHTIFGILAAIIGLASYWPYFRSILRGETKPNRATVGIWALTGIVGATSYVASGARATALLPCVNAVCGIAVFLLALKHGVGGTSKLDIFCLLGAVVGIVGWKATGNPHTALYLTMLASTCGFAPKLKKVYFEPYTENKTAWIMYSVAAAFSLCALTKLEPYLVLYPLYLFVFDTAIAVLVTIPRKTKIQGLQGT